MILYLDTSALVKLYTLEAGSDRVRQMVANAELVATSLLSYVEAQSAFAKKQRLAEITAADFRRSSREFEREWAEFNRLPVDEALTRKAGEFCNQYSLRAYDALHLASANFLQMILGVPVLFACFDTALNRAARASHLETLVAG